MRHSSRNCETQFHAKTWSKKGSPTDRNRFGWDRIARKHWPFSHVKTWERKSRKSYHLVLPAWFLLPYTGQERKKKSVSVSHSAVSNSLQSHRLWHARLLCPWDSSGKNTRVGYHFLLQRIFPTRESNLVLLYYRQILYHLNHQGSPILGIGTPVSTQINDKQIIV